LGLFKSAVEGFVREAKPSDGSQSREPTKKSKSDGERKVKGSSTAPKKVFDRPNVKAR
jgi:hypothetical protein